MLLKGCARYQLSDFESYLRFVVGLHENDIWLNLKQYKSIFVTFERPPGIYSVKAISELVYTMVLSNLKMMKLA